MRFKQGYIYIMSIHVNSAKQNYIQIIKVTKVANEI